MYSIKTIISLILFLCIGYAYNLYALSTGISEDAVDILTKTGRAMAEVAEAVKPAVVNISSTRVEKIKESPLAPFFEDPYFRRFFG